ncbi:MAG: glycosyltransferase family 39 protein [Actinobacteria bacterium]|nr:glycosyltransferase family 39 protein [Actinomycetota bacterium]
MATDTIQGADPIIVSPRREDKLSSIFGWELGLLVGLILIGFAAHAFNMFNAPSFKEDEGIYAAQSWSMLRQGTLSPYTYTYDHAPGGWILSSIWMALTGGPATFGGAILSGRMLVLLVHLASIPLVYRIGRKLGCEVWMAALATLIFSLSPLSLTYQRLFMLDNLMVFWLLLSINLLLDGWGRLSRHVLSGLTFGIAFLTKETAIFLLPAMLYIAFGQRWRHQGRFAVGAWVMTAFMTISWYPLFAALKGELLPAGQALFAVVSNDPGPHVSLFEAVKWQATRSGGGLFSLDNMFWQLVRGEWLRLDPILLIGGVAACGINLMRAKQDRRALATALLGLLPFVYLARGGIVFDFYFVLAIPLLALNIGSALSWIFSRSRGPLAAAVALILLIGSGLLWTGSGDAMALLAERPTEANREAVRWIKANIPSKSRIVARDDFWADLREPFRGPAFPNTHSHWKVGADPDVRDAVFHGDWRRIDYLLITPDMPEAFEASGNELVMTALENAHLVKRWKTGGNTVELWKVTNDRPLDAGILEKAHKHISEHFEKDGAFFEKDGSVTSEAQSYALLRSVWMDDRETFDRAWDWTRENLQRDDALLSWKWQNGRITDEASATDADTDTALALLMAGQQWEEDELVDEGTRMVSSIFEHEVAVVNGTPYITAGDWWETVDDAPINPSYFSPYAYRIFAEVDPDNDWGAVIDSGYSLLFEVTESVLGHDNSAGLPPDWIGIEPSTGKFVPIEMGEKDATDYGYDAARTWWRVAMDYSWSEDGRAASYLEQSGFLADEVERKGFVSSVYSHDGEVVERGPSMVGTAGAIAALGFHDRPKAERLFSAQVLGGLQGTTSEMFWTPRADLYAQEWGWFASAIYEDRLPNLWTDHD